MERHVSDIPGLGLLQIVMAGNATIGRGLTRRLAVERNVTIEHGEKARTVGRVAGLHHDFKGHAALAAGERGWSGSIFRCRAAALFNRAGEDATDVGERAVAFGLPVIEGGLGGVEIAFGGRVLVEDAFADQGFSDIG